MSIEHGGTIPGEFLRTAISDGAVSRLREKAREKTGGQLARLTRNLNITATYLGSPASLDEVAQIYEADFSSRERCRQIIVKTLERIYTESSPHVQNQFPKEELNSVRKPLNSDTRFHKMIQRGGRAKELYELLQQRVPVEEIIENGDFNIAKIGYYRIQLNLAGVEVPRIRKNQRQFIAELKKATDKDEIRELLAEVDESVYSSLRHRKDDVLIPLSRIVHVASREFHYLADILREEDIPFAEIKHVVKSGPQKGESSYFLIHFQHKDLVSELLKENMEMDHLQKGRVEQLAGPECDQLPSFFEIQQKINLVGLYEILSSEGIRITGADSIRVVDLLEDDCPVAVFRYKHKKKNYSLWAIYEKDKEAFLEYIRNKKKT